jgi:putative transcriptional regulator
MNDEMFSELLESVQEAGAISRGEKEASRRYVINSVDIVAVRKKTQKTQEDFARMIGVTVGTLRNWEQGRRKPEGPALTLLRIVFADPAYVEQILQTQV